jgi:hypothetical protein
MQAPRHREHSPPQVGLLGHLELTPIQLRSVGAMAAEDTTVGELASIPGFGARSLLEVLSATSVPPAPSLVPRAGSRERPGADA